MASISPRAMARDIPIFSLYGEAEGSPAAGYVHGELIESRSSRYDWQIGRHLHRGLFQTLFVFRGSVEARIDSRRETLEGAAILGIPPGVVHDFRFSPGTHGIVLTVAEALLFDRPHQAESLPLRELFLQPRILRPTPGHPDVARMEALLLQLLAELAWPRPGHDAMTQWLAKAALLLVARGHAEAGSGGAAEQPEAALFIRFRALVEAHYTEHWQVRRYAEALHTTAGRLDRICRNAAGRSAFEIVQQRLMLEARRRLIFVSATVAMLAYELGFQDPAYFCRCFKKYAGVTPSAFRRQAAAGGADQASLPR